MSSRPKILQAIGQGFFLEESLGCQDSAQGSSAILKVGLHLGMNISPFVYIYIYRKIPGGCWQPIAKSFQLYMVWHQTRVDCFPFGIDREAIAKEFGFAGLMMSFLNEVGDRGLHSLSYPATSLVGGC